MSMAPALQQAKEREKNTNQDYRIKKEHFYQERII